MKHRRDLWMIGSLALVLVAVVVGMEWTKSSQSAKPKSLVTTIKGEASTSRAFTWVTSRTDTAVVQLVAGEQLDEAVFEGDQVMMIEGITSVVELGQGKQQSVHKAEVTGLKPGTLYTYRVGSGQDKEWSQMEQFRTESAEAKEFTFLNVTDSQGVTEADFELWGNTLNKAFQTFPDAGLIVHNGDLTDDPEDEHAWEAFFDAAQPWIAQVPLMPVTGNNDEVDGDVERYVSHFNLPDNGAPGVVAGTSYSFDYGNAHFVMLNTESGIKKQTEWLREDLAATDQDWIIVSTHRGAYAGNRYEKIDDWVQVFDEFEVDLVLQGHNHEYARSHPLRGGKVVGSGEDTVYSREGTVYVVTNTSGPKFNEKKEDQFYHKVHFQNYKQMFAGITIAGDTLTYQAYDVDGQLLDEFELRH